MHPATLPPSGSLQKLQFEEFSAEIMEETISNTRTEHAQATSGQFSGCVLHARAGQTFLDSGIYSQAIIGRMETPPDRVLLGLIWPERRGGILEGHSLNQCTPLCYTEASELTVRLEARTRWLALQVPRSTLDALEVELPMQYSGPVQIEHASQAEFADIEHHLRILSTAGDATVSERYLEESVDQLLSLFASGMSSAPSHLAGRASSAHRKLLRRALEYINENLAEALRISELCAHTQTSYKTLERAFRGLLGITPRQYLTLRRLEQARSLLREGNSQYQRISEIATNCGFDELGRFSGLYRRQFGETPSSTRKKAQTT